MCIIIYIYIILSVLYYTHRKIEIKQLHIHMEQNERI